MQKVPLDFFMEVLLKELFTNFKAAQEYSLL